MEIELKKLGEITTGSTPSKKNNSYWDTKDICFVKPDGISDNGITLINDSSEYISENARCKARVVSKDAVFVTCIGSIGKIGIADSGEYAFNQQINVIETNDRVLPRYLAYNLLYSKPRIIAIANAPVVPIINKTQFGDFVVSIDEDKEKQAKIVSVLDKLTSIIEFRKKELESFDKLIKARFVEMFGNPVIGDKIKGNKRKVGEFASVTKLAGFEFTKYIQYKETGDIIMLRGLNCKKGQLVLDDIKWIDQETSDLLPRSKLYYGDILMTYAGTIGDVAMVDADNKYHLAPNVGKITIEDKDSINPVYLMHLFMYSHDYIMTFASQVAQASINMEKIRNFEYYFPRIEEQNEFEAFVKQIDKSKVVIQNSLEETQLLFDSLMQEYFG